MSCVEVAEMIKEYFMVTGYYGWGVVGLSLLALVFVFIFLFTKNRNLLYLIILLSISSILVGLLGYFSGNTAVNEAIDQGLHPSMNDAMKENIKKLVEAGHKLSVKPLKVSLYSSVPFILFSLLGLIFTRVKARLREK